MKTSSASLVPSHFRRDPGKLRGLADELGAGWIVYTAVLTSWLYVAAPVARLPTSATPGLHASTVLRRHTYNPPSKAPYLHVYTPSARLHICMPTARLASSRSPVLHVCTTAARLQNSIPLRLHVCTTTVRLQRSKPPYLQVCISAARLRSSMPPPRLHSCSATQDL